MIKKINILLDRVKKALDKSDVIIHCTYEVYTSLDNGKNYRRYETVHDRKALQLLCDTLKHTYTHIKVTTHIIAEKTIKVRFNNNQI